jgi:hypothetical protein
VTSIAVDDLDNAVNGYGATVDLAAQLGIVVGTGISVTCHGGVVGETGVSAGAVQLQLGIAGATGIVWSTLGSAASVGSGTATTMSAPAALSGATHARVVVSTPIVGGKATAIITV